MSRFSKNTIKTACVATLVYATTAFSQQLNTYDEIKSVITKGISIRILVNYDKCTNSSLRKLSGNSYAIYTPNAISLSKDGHIGTYVMYFTMHDGLFPGKPVYEYGNYVITKDNSLNITWTILNAADYTQLSNTLTTNCKLGDSAIVFSVQHPASTKGGMSKIDSFRNKLNK